MDAHPNSHLSPYLRTVSKWKADRDRAAVRKPAALVIDDAKPQTPAGPQCLAGTELKALLKKWLGIEATPTCRCNSMASKMDWWGCDECERPDRIEEVVALMRSEHAKRAQAGRISIPWSDVAARTVIRLAIRQARKKQAKAVAG